MTLEEILKLMNTAEGLATILLPDMIALVKLILSSDQTMTIGELQALAQQTLNGNKVFYDDWMKAHPEV